MDVLPSNYTFSMAKLDCNPNFLLKVFNHHFKISIKTVAHRPNLRFSFYPAFKLRHSLCHLHCQILFDRCYCRVNKTCLHIMLLSAIKLTFTNIPN